MRLANPSPGRVVAWVTEHLGHLCSDVPEASPRFRGTQEAADAALRASEVDGYARRRSEVWPTERRGASGLSPWIRHGFLTLPRVWAHVEGGPAADVSKFRDELLWAEYSRHLYARLGQGMAEGLRASRTESMIEQNPWDRSMACMDLTVGELERDGWLVNQTRMWLASQWAVRQGAPWRDGEDRFFTHLLDGSRASNRSGWQWTVGTGNGKSYGFARWQVEKRAPGLCDTCVHRRSCPIERFGEDVRLHTNSPHPLLREDHDTTTTAGPIAVQKMDEPDVVWLTAESVGDDDPALRAHPDLDVLFIFDEPLLRRLRLSGKRLIFLTERLAELADERPVELHVGRPRDVLCERRVATTFAPVPGWRSITNHITPVELHPWPWLRRPNAGTLMSFSAWSGTSFRDRRKRS